MRLLPPVIPLLATVLWSGPSGASPAPIKVRVYPERPLIERDEHQQYLNCDFGLENSGDSAMTLERIEMSVFDAGNRLVRRQFVWSKGAASPGMLTIPERTIPARGSIGLFNPFYALPPSLELHRLHFEFVFGTRGIEPIGTVGIDVLPIRYRTPVGLVLPVDGPAVVYDGHDFYSHHRRIPLGSASVRREGWDVNPVRYANDLSPVGPAGELAHGPLADPTSWYGYGALVRAPAAGEVVSVRNDVEDNRIENGELVYPPGSGEDLLASTGNHVAIKHPGGLVSFLAHLKKGSVRVKVGQRVAQGEPVGAIGFSGDTGFHVHVHHMLLTSFSMQVESVPSYFDRVRRVALPRSASSPRGAVLMGARIDTGDLIESVRP